MTIDDVIKLVNAGFKADQIAQMYAAEKIDPPAPPQENPQTAPLPGAQTPPITQETQQTPLSVPAEPPKVEEAPKDSNKEIEDLKKQLEASQASVQSLQNLMASVNVAGTVKTETAEDYLKKIFSEMC